MLERANNYQSEITTVRQYGENVVRIVEMRACKISGLELEVEQTEKLNHSQKGSVNQSKLANNLSRAKSKVRELALCNKWQYFCTFTVSPDKFDRYNLKAYQKQFSEFIHGYNKHCSSEEKVRYLLIPEMHKDGAWHMHGLIMGIKSKDLYTNQNGYLTWKQYEERFGYISMSEIRSIDKTANYIMKYMTKDIAKGVTDLGAHLYYSSKGLEQSVLLYKGHAYLHCDWDYVHPDGYCRTKTLDIQDVGCYLEVL